MEEREKFCMYSYQVIRNSVNLRLNEGKEEEEEVKDDGNVAMLDRKLFFVLLFKIYITNKNSRTRKKIFL